MTHDHAAIMATIDSWIDRPALHRAAAAIWQETLATWHEEVTHRGHPSTAIVPAQLRLDFQSLTLITEAIGYDPPLPNVEISYHVQEIDLTDPTRRPGVIGFFACRAALDGTIYDNVLHLSGTIRDHVLFWYEELARAMKTPWTAQCHELRAISPLQVGEQVMVVRMAPVEECRYELFVVAQHYEQEIIVPLAQLTLVSGTKKCRQAVARWHTTDVQRRLD